MDLYRAIKAGEKSKMQYRAVSICVQAGYRNRLSERHSINARLTRHQRETKLVMKAQLRVIHALKGFIELKGEMLGKSVSIERRNGTASS